MATDPLSLVYDALWDILEAHKPFTRLIKPGNRIKYSGRRDPEKDGSGDSDYPKVRILPVGGETHLERTSSSGFLSKRFQIQVATGDRRVDERLFPVEWEIIRAMHGWRTKLEALTWEEAAFAKGCLLTDIQDGLTLDESREKIIGWAAVWACEVPMWFPTTLLQPDT